MIMFFLLYGSILWSATCVSSLPAPSRIFMSARVGSSAVLPCDWRNVSTQSPHVEWRTYTETVFERRGEELYQGEGYKERVDVPEDHLLKGDCSLELKNVRPEDAGVYESFLLVRRTKRSLRTKRVFLQSVELSVDDAPEESHSENKAAACSAGTIQTSSWITAIFLLFFLLFTSFHLSVDHHLDVVERLAQS
uniref:Ig-like domain-containing protein n=1 Tax=Pygocentrus nattereri TaxID=42514 RepID=A0AAR2KRN4_PYGNA